MTFHIRLSNAGGTLSCDTTSFGERQACRVAVRNVPLRTAGSFVDTGTWTLRNRVLSMAVRLSDAQKTTLQAIFDARASVTIYTIDDGTNNIWWKYVGWFRKKPLIYEYSKQELLREWIAELEFDLSGFDYDVGPKCGCPTGENATNGDFETGDLTGWSSAGDPTVVNNGAHGGTYYVEFDSTDDSIWQTFAGLGLLKTSLTKLSVWASWAGCGSMHLKVKVYYSDATDETVAFTNIPNSWTEHDVLSNLSSPYPPKCIIKVAIWFNFSGAGGGPKAWLDDVSIICG